MEEVTMLQLTLFSDGKIEATSFRGDKRRKYLNLTEASLMRLNRLADFPFMYGLYTCARIGGQYYGQGRHVTIQICRAP